MRSRLLEINEVLQVGEDKEEVRAVDVVEVAMTGRAERNGDIGVAKMYEGYETLLTRSGNWRRKVSAYSDQQSIWGENVRRSLTWPIAPS